MTDQPETIPACEPADINNDWREDQLRQSAMQYATATFGGSSNPQAILEAANQYYKFLKGEAQ